MRPGLAVSIGLGCAWLVASAGCSVPSLHRSLEREIGGAPGQWGIWFQDLQSGETVDLGATRLFHAASTMKLLVLAALQREMEAGRLRLEERVLVKRTFPSAVEGEFEVEAEDPTVLDAIGEELPIGELRRAMIVTSDNLATNLLIERLGGPASVTATARQTGLQLTSVARYIMDSAAFEAGLSSRAEPRELGLWLARLWRGEILGARASSAMFELLSQVGPNWLGRELPAGARAAHKTGAMDGVRHDVGIITTSGGRSFVLCVFSEELRDEAAAEVAISRLSRLCYEHVAR